MEPSSVRERSLNAIKGNLLNSGLQSIQTVETDETTHTTYKNLDLAMAWSVLKIPTDRAKFNPCCSSTQEALDSRIYQRVANVTLLAVLLLVELDSSEPSESESLSELF
ncbi:hypothetical protein BPOR_0176g00190 [Botrytis porri]|uniref:Uncharacterized protein n=1 Tax=Botrytis porri TaxID=87229 RepID=A0A4Z1KUL7_9HELO|nr:hypothetical protein BPOR_0176g00190 [Botrytis porri]